VRYDARRNGVLVTLDSEANDGEPGEQDFVSLSIESVYAGGGADVLVGDERSNRLIGAGGADVIRGGAGNDQLSGGNRLWGRVGSNDRLYGGAGADWIAGNAGDDLLFGGRGRDNLQAFSGADRLLLGPGRDVARAGPGDDLIYARDGSVDAVGCGLGVDRVRNDGRDYVTAGTCDRHDRGRKLASVFDFRP
jgi:Ca2+-binding RTX toxin-like protein